MRTNISINTQTESQTEIKKFSVFHAPIENTVPHAAVTIQQIFKAISGNKYADRTAEMRAIADEKERKKYKSQKLDYVTFSGTFSKRSDSALINHSGLICIDIDHIESLSEVRLKILESFIPVLLFISPSGDGLKVIYHVDINSGTHEEYFTAIKEFYFQQFDIKIDRTGDVSRACFLCHDPEAHYTDTPTILDRSFIDTFTFQAQISPSVEETDNRPGDLFNKSIDSSREAISALMDAGWKDVGNKKWRRPGKDEGISASFGHIAENIFYNFSDNGDPFEPNKAYTPFQVVTLLKYNGDFSAHAADLAKRYNLQKPATVADPIPLLPISGLPESIQTIINVLSEVYGTHRDFWAASFLSATALAIGSTRQVKGKYVNSSVFWFLIIAPSGSGKTEPFSFFFSPFHKRDSQALIKHEQQLAEIERAKAAKETPPEKTIYSQFILSDTTPEALLTVHRDSPRGICLLRDELQGLFLDFGRYNKSGEQQTYLSAWSEQPITVNRKGQAPLKVQSPFIGICGGVQPDILPQLAAENRAVNGFLPRFCAVYPDEVKRPPYTDDTLPNEIKEAYADYFNNLLSLSGSEPIYLSNEAQELYAAFVSNNSEIINDEKIDYLRAVYAKLDIIVLRLALVIHYCKWATGANEDRITADTMQAAIDMTEYFRATGKKVYTQLGIASEKMNKKDVAKYLKNMGASQNEIAAAMKVSQPYINKILK